MPSSEHIFHRSRVVFGPPDDKTGGDASDQTKPESPQLHGADFGDRATWNKAVATASELQMYGTAGLANRILGLPENTTKEQVEEYIYHQEAIYVARDYGLSDDTPEGVIDELLQKEEEEKLRKKARVLGLPEDATGNQIFEKEMELRAQKVGLPDNAKWGDIWRDEKEEKRKIIFEALGIPEDDKTWDWEDVLRRALCVSGLETSEDYIKRIQEIRAWHIERLVKGEVKL